MNFIYNFDTTEEKEEFLKTRVSSLGLSARIERFLADKNLLTIRGLLNKSEKELKKEGLNADEIKLIFSGFRFLESSIKLNFKKRELNRENNINNFDFLYKLEEENKKNVISSLGGNDVLKYFSDYFKIDKSKIIGSSRKREIVEIRDIIVYVLRKYGELSFPVIAKILGDRDHTTIIYSFKKTNQINHGIENKFFDLVFKIKELKNENKLINNDVVIESKISTDFVKFSIPNNPQIISERSSLILSQFREGLSLEAIGLKHDITRERVRQILKNILWKISINESIENNSEIQDADKIYKNEINHRILKRKELRPQKINIIKEKKWGARKYDFCKICNTVDFPHFRNSICQRCAGAFRGEARESIIKDHSGKCDQCGITREEAKISYGRDMYISKKIEVLCKKCYLTMNGKILGDFKKNKWKMFYK